MTRVRSKKEKLGDSPPDVYKHIKKEDWATFKEKMMSDHAIREKALESAKKNTHHHHLGQRSYGDARELWRQEKFGPPSFDSGSSSSNHPPRSPPVLTGLEYKEKQAKGEFIPVRNRDALFMALGEKPDHPGRCYGFGGVNVGYTKAFGHVPRTHYRRSMKEQEEALIQKMSERCREDIATYMQNVMISPLHPSTGPYSSPSGGPSPSHVQPPTQSPGLYHFFPSPFAMPSPPTQPTQPPIPTSASPFPGPYSGPLPGPYSGPPLGPSPGPPLGPFPGPPLGPFPGPYPGPYPG
ncbi:uncharacterized protein LOC130589654 [Beta vulgaris subsp. vulgaris]|uniref:uncharacterized protein LOC130589654 n=1 Tax=Beta vulgaris subsp. vulgaris TaxID=3555 RepID=UPI0025489B56|nr:uncharacterized protein LOC130589654 [Beta vulgaris subsp. vulgaris]